MFQIIRKAYRPSLLILLCLSVAVIFVIFSSCTTRVEGCLDIAATNFDFTADKACDDCCTYPTISLGLSPHWGDDAFNTADTLKDKNGQSYRITDLKYILSAWAWHAPGQSLYTVDSASVACGPGVVNYTPDILLVDTRQANYVLGIIHKAPNIDSLTFNVGVVPDLACVDASALSTPVILSDKSPLWDASSSSRADIRIILLRDLTTGILDTLYIKTFQPVKLAYNFSFSAGIPVLLKLSVDYAKWFSEVDVTDTGSFENSVKNHIQGSFYKTP